MAKTQKIQELLLDIDRNDYFLPEFQRGFVWNADKIKQYFNSLYLEYPTGSFLVWKSNTPPKMRGSNVDESRTFSQLILDGQQRLTTLYSMIRGTPPPWFEGKKKVRTDLYFNIQTEEFQYYMVTHMQGKDEWIHVPSFLNQGALPFIENDPEKSQFLFQSIRALTKLEAILKYEYHIQEIHEQDPNKVVMIFNLVNSQGTTLSKTDLTLAVLTNRWEQCKDSMRACSDKFCEIGFEFDMTFFTRCIAVVGTHRGLLDDMNKLTQEDIIEAWGKVEKALDYLCNILIQYAYIDGTKFLSTKYILYPLVYFLSKNNFQVADTSIRDKLIYWLYNALIWGRYSGSSESFLEQDIRILKETNSVDELIKTLIQFRGGSLDITAEDLHLQGMNSRFYQMVYILIRSNNATDWADSSLPLYHKSIGAKYSIEKHHIFPKSKLYKIFKSNISYEKKLVNEISNMAFLTSKTNLGIFNNDPDIYLSNIDSEILQQQFVPLNREFWQMTKEGYKGFLAERRRMLADGINHFLNRLHKGDASIHVNWDVDHWRSQLEEIESKIRDLIVYVFLRNKDDIEWSFVPHHILPKIKDRIKKYLKDHPGEETEQYEKLEQQVKFFDVAEYCDLMVSKENWNYFEKYFGDKPSLQQRFQQLQKFRNTLAHGRDLSDVIIKEGEASILWLSSAITETVKINE